MLERKFPQLNSCRAYPTDDHYYSQQQPEAGHDPRDRDPYQGDPDGYRQQDRQVGGIREVDLLGGLRQAVAALGELRLGHGGVLVDGRGQERGAEDEDADGARDQRGADVLLGQSAVHEAMVCIRSVPESDIRVTPDCALAARS